MIAALNRYLILSELFGPERPWWLIQKEWKKGESKRLRGEGDQIKFIHLRFERWQVAGLRKARRKQDVLQIAISWDRS